MTRHSRVWFAVYCVVTGFGAVGFAVVLCWLFGCGGLFWWSLFSAVFAVGAGLAGPSPHTGPAYPRPDARDPAPPQPQIPAPREGEPA